MLKRGLNIAYEYIDGSQAMLTEADWTKFKANGVDHIRLPWRTQTMFTDSPTFTTVDATKKQRFDNIMNKALGLQLSVILDCHDIDSTAIGVAYGKMPEIWTYLANQYKTKPVDDGTATGYGVYYEIFNEPQDSDPANWLTLHQAAYNTIVAIDLTGRQFIINGLYGADPHGLDAVTPVTETISPVIYTFHEYNPYSITHCGASWVNLQGMSNLDYPSNPAQVQQQYTLAGNSSTPPEWYIGFGGEQILSDVLQHPKAWASSHGKQLYCGEGGVFAQFQRVETIREWCKDFIWAMNEADVGYALFCYGTPTTTGFPVDDVTLGYVRDDWQTTLETRDGVTAGNGQFLNASAEGGNIFTQLINLFRRRSPVATNNAFPVAPSVDNRDVGVDNPLPVCYGNIHYRQFQAGSLKGATSTDILPANPYRKMLMIQNTSTATVWLRFNTTFDASKDAYAWKVLAGDYWPKTPGFIPPKDKMSMASDDVGIADGEYSRLQIIEGY